MKILLVSHEGELNGASQSLLNLIDCLQERHTIYVLTCYQEGPFVEALGKRNCTVWYAPYYRWVKTKYTTWHWCKSLLKWYGYEQWVTQRSARQLAKRVQEEQISLVHSNTRVVQIGGLIARYAGIRHVWHFREFGEEDFAMYPVMSAKRHYQKIGQMCDAVIAISGAIEQKFRPLLPAALPVIRVYNGVSKAHVQEKEPYVPKQVSFLISGRISETKGQKEALQAALLLRNQGYTNFKIYMAGTKSNAAYQLWDKKTESVRPYVELLGNVSDMPALRQKMDVELVCSKAEAFGRVTVEAMMSSLPVIGSAAGGTPELIQHGVNGYLYKPGDAADLAEKMGYCLAHPEQIVQMGHAAYEATHTYFRIERCAGEIEQVYEAVMHRRNTG